MFEKVGMWQKLVPKNTSDYFFCAYFEKCIVVLFVKSSCTDDKDIVVLFVKSSCTDDKDIFVSTIKHKEDD